KRLRRSSSSASGRTVSGSTTSVGDLMNQYDSTGTMVKATNSDDSIAMVTVSANGEKSSPTMPPTSAIGTKTATVVNVEAVIAPATSRTAVKMARVFSSP